MTDEEPGLLGNLPRSRPGTRSDKRASKATAAAKKPAAKRKPPAKKKPAPAAKPQPEPVASKSVPPSPNPLESAVKVAGAGLRVAEGVTREVLRRLPRP